MKAPFVSVGVCLVAALPVAVLWSFRASGFVADDIFFAANFWIPSWKELLLGEWPHVLPASKAWRPVVLLSYFFQHALTGGRPEPYHLFNYILHGANAALLAVLASKVSGRWLVGLLAGALFAVHPLGHENVQWISGRTYPLSALFLLALCVWTMDSGRRPARYQHAVAAMLTALAVGAYEFGIVAPLLIACLKWRTWKSSGRAVASATRDLAPCLAVLAVYFLFRWFWLSDFNQDVVMAARSSQVLRGIKTIRYRLFDNVFLFTWRLLAWPTVMQTGGLRLSVTGVCTTTAVIVATAVIARDRRLRAQAVGWILFALAGFLPVAAYASFNDRFGYLSIAGVAAFIALAAVRLLDAPGRLARASACAGVLVLGLLWARDLRAHAQDWKEAGDLATRIVHQTVALLPPPTRPLDVHVIGVPETHGSAWVFITYFPLAVHSQYPLQTARLLHFHLQAETPPEIVTRGLAPRAEREERILAWDAATQTMSLRYARTAGSDAWTPHPAE